MTLSQIEQYYLDAGISPIFRSNTEVTPYIDGKFYFAEIAATIRATQGSGDCIYLVAWGIDLDWDLSTGREKLDPSHPDSLGNLLAQKAASGVDVRVILSGTLPIYWEPLFPPWQNNIEAADALRSLHADGSRPLANRVLLDWSGANWSGSHHQKAWVFKCGQQLIAFVGGMDPRSKTHDYPPHNHKTRESSIGEVSDWGWHDAGIKLAGVGARQVWENFRDRWLQVDSLPDETYPRHLLRILGRTQLNPRPIPQTPDQSPEFTQLSDTNFSVQVLRSRYEYKLQNKLSPGGEPWLGIAKGRIDEIYQGLKRAIEVAREYIYIEDQYLTDTPCLEGFPTGTDYSLYPLILDALLRNGNLKVIFLGSGRTDPAGVTPSTRNQEITASIQQHIVDPLRAVGEETRVVVYRLELATVHSKLILIDDKFAAIGSANAQSRSLSGVDDELQVVYVTDGEGIQGLRMKLWAEHWDIPIESASDQLLAAFRHIPTALGIWRPSWLPEEVDRDMWQASNHPRGYRPTSAVGNGSRGWLRFVGPTPKVSSTAEAD